MPSVLPLRRVWLPLLAVAVLFATGARASDFDDTLWNLTGSTTVRIGSVSETVAVTGTLSLNADRTYTLSDNDPMNPDETGVWFENRGRLLFYTQNLLEQIVALETALGSAFGETARVSVLKGSGKASVNSKTGLLTVQGSNQMSAFFETSNVSLVLTTRTSLTGTLAP